MQPMLNVQIKKLRTQMSLTQERLAEALGVTVGAVSKWENGNTIPDISMLMNIADFFNISLDVLLGLNISSKNESDICARIKNLYKEHRFDEAIEEADKALVRYPNSFSILYGCAELFGAVGVITESNQKKERALELYKKSLLFISQNTDPTISEFSIQRSIAHCETDSNRALEAYKKLNYDGINDIEIGMILTLEQKEKEASATVSKAFYSCVFRMFEAVIAEINYLVLIKDFNAVIELADWYDGLLEGLCIKGKGSYLEKLRVTLITIKAQAAASQKDMEKAKQYLKEALEHARSFDKNPVYSVSTNVKFWYDKEDSPTAYDSLGLNAVDGITAQISQSLDKKNKDKVLLPISGEDEDMKALLACWEEIKKLPQ